MFKNVFICNRTPMKPSANDQPGFLRWKDDLFPDEHTIASNVLNE